MKILRNINWMELSGLLVGALLASVVCILGAVFVAKLMQDGVIGVDEYHLYSDFQSGQGLHKGTKVQINGVEVGKVSKLELTDGGRVRLEFTLRSQYRAWITDSAKAFATRDQNVISERVVNIEIAKGGQILEDGGQIAASTAQDIETVLKTANELIDRIGKLVVTADTLLKLAADTNTTVGVLLGSRKLYDQIEYQLYKLDTITTSVNTMAGSANGLLATTNVRIPRLLDKADTIANGVMRLSGDVNELSGKAKTLVSSLDTTATKVGILVDQLQGTASSVGGLLTDGTRTLQNADDLVGGISKFWFIRGKIPAKDTIPLLGNQSW